jgi:hypothetical protein
MGDRRRGATVPENLILGGSKDGGRVRQRPEE